MIAYPLHCASFGQMGQKSDKNGLKMIKKCSQKDYLGDGLLTHVFLGGVWSGFTTRKSDFLMVFGLKFGQSAADSLEVLMKTSIQVTLTWGVPPMPLPTPSFSLIMHDWSIALRSDKQTN